MGRGMWDVAALTVPLRVLREAAMYGYEKAGSNGAGGSSRSAGHRPTSSPGSGPKEDHAPCQDLAGAMRERVSTALRPPAAAPTTPVKAGCHASGSIDEVSASPTSFAFS